LAVAKRNPVALPVSRSAPGPVSAPSTVTSSRSWLSGSGSRLISGCGSKMRSGSELEGCSASFENPLSKSVAVRMPTRRRFSRAAAPNSAHGSALAAAASCCPCGCSLSFFPEVVQLASVRLVQMDQQERPDRSSQQGRPGGYSCVQDDVHQIHGGKVSAYLPRLPSISRASYQRLSPSSWSRGYSEAIGGDDHAERLGCHSLQEL